MQYCAYVPWKMSYDLKEVKDLYKTFTDYLLDDDQLDDNLSVLKKFTWNESSISLLRYDDHISLIVIDRQGYRPRNVLSVIADIDRDQCFIALYTDWIDSVQEDFSTEDISKLEQLYKDNQHRIYSAFDYSFQKIVTKHFPEVEFSVPVRYASFA